MKLENIRQILNDLTEFGDIEVELKFYFKPKKVQKKAKISVIGSKILEIILKLLPHAPTVKDIANELNRSLKCSPKFSPRKVGYIVRNELGLSPVRTERGYVLKDISQIKDLAKNKRGY